MSAIPATVHLSSSVLQSRGTLLRLLLRLEAWLDARRSARALYFMDDRALSDLGLSRSDVERVNTDVRQPTGLRTRHDLQLIAGDATALSRIAAA